MSEISTALVKELREKTGVGMMDCKKALAENGGDIEAAIDWLRAKGLSKAAKKADRVAAEGLVGLAVRPEGAGMTAAVIELNSETDFVARNDIFQNAVAQIATAALGTDGSPEAILAAKADGGSVQDMITGMIASIGENMTLRRAARISVGAGVVSTYVHTAARDGMGRIGVAVALESAGDKGKLEDLGRRIAMHVAAAAPIAATESEIPTERVERERTVLLEQLKEDPKAAGKPQQVLDKMIEGRMRKFFEEVVLTKQAFVMNPDQTIEALLAEEAKALGAPVALTGFIRFALGEGVEKKTDDFAAEVAAMTGSTNS
jgi:elongation factor Ts